MTNKPAYRTLKRADQKAAAMREILGPWFRENGRNLPWRRTRDPWRILVSEVMLQQIQVARAIPFYERFLERFPTVESLAEAPVAEAIRTWADLGRYRRVVNLHRTSRIVVEEHGGAVPSDPAVLVRLPGIGPYTAGAVACFAFEKDVAFFDTNMHRVLHRVFYGPEIPEPAAKAKEILTLAADLVPPGGGWAWNQAIMEFGALRCTARKPLCGGCPLQSSCEAHPGMTEAIAGVPRAPRGGRTAGYEGSNRHLRGRVLALLREDAAGRGVGLEDLGERLLGDATAAELRRMREVAGSLEADGLARVLPPEGTATDGPAEAVAEEKVAYDAVPADSDARASDLRKLRVALP